MEDEFRDYLASYESIHDYDECRRNRGVFTEHGYLSLSGDEWAHEKSREAEKKPSIRERLEDAKRECAERPKPEKQHSGRSTPEHGDL